MKYKSVFVPRNTAPCTYSAARGACPSRRVATGRAGGRATLGLVVVPRCVHTACGCCPDTVDTEGTAYLPTTVAPSSRRTALHRKGVTVAGIDREFEFYEFFHSENLTNFTNFFRLKKIRKKIVILQIIDV